MLSLRRQSRKPVLKVWPSSQQVWQRCVLAGKMLRIPKICPYVSGEDGETESSSDEEEISEAESDADEARGAPSVIADTLGSQEEALTQARPRAMPHTEGSL